MISDRLADFVHGPVIGFVGTRDSRLRPEVTWAFGARVSAASDEITTFVPDVEIDRTRSNLAHNGIVAYTVVAPSTHESYQFKGKLVSLRPTTEEEQAVQDILISKLVSQLPSFPPELFGGYVTAPSTALTFRVEQVFVQTPGPGAGRQLDLSADA
jgi:hypothetical protein